jgi:ribonuclease J
LEIKFYGGVDEIGGNRILVRDRHSAALLDFGISFSKNGKFFEEYLKPRYASSGMKDLLRLGLVHYVRGFYRSDLLRLIGKEPDDTPSIDATILSHIHQDHSGLVSLLDERIPVICSRIAKTYANALLKVGTRSIETEVCNFRRRPVVDKHEKPIARKFLPNTYGKEQKIGEITIVPYPVDHSVLGASAYILKTTNSTIVYTGDLRYHPSENDFTRKFTEAAANADPDILLCEGTRIGESGGTTEEYVRYNAVETIRSSRTLVIADFAFRDVTRLVTFYAVAKDTGRKFVITKRDAYLLDALNSCDDLPFDLPLSKDKNILVYIDKKQTGRYTPDDYRYWERRYLEASNSIHANEIHEHQADFLIHLTFFDINELVDIDPYPNAIYIHSASEAHNEEQFIDERRLNNWLNYFQARKYHYHASGHASGPEIKEIVQTIKPKVVIPIHTEHPEVFKRFCDNVEMPVLEPFVAM